MVGEQMRGCKSPPRIKALPLIGALALKMQLLCTGTLWYIAGSTSLPRLTLCTVAFTTDVPLLRNDKLCRKHSSMQCMLATELVIAQNGHICCEHNCAEKCCERVCLLQQPAQVLQGVIMLLPEDLYHTHQTPYLNFLSCVFALCSSLRRSCRV